MNKKSYKFIIILLLSPWMLGMKAGYNPTESFYYIKGNIRSTSSQTVSGLKIFIEYSDSDSLFYFYQQADVNLTDSNGNYNIRDSFNFYDNNVGAIRLKVIVLRDTILGDTLKTRNANHFEILGEQSGCSSKNSPTTEVYTFPDQTITVP